MLLSRRELLMIGAAVAIDAPARAAQLPTRGRPLLVSVLTCPRPGGVSYLAGTLAAVDAELPGVRKLVIFDGGTPASRDGWTVATYPARPPRPPHGYQDNREPAWVAIWAAFSSGSDLLFLEDDIRPIAPGSFAAMAQHEVVDICAFASFHHLNRAPGVYDVASFNMSQAVLVPWRSLSTLWTRRHEVGRATWVDLAIAEVGRRAGWRFEQTENLVRHVGTISAAMPGHVWDRGPS